MSSWFERQKTNERIKRGVTHFYVIGYGAIFAYLVLRFIFWLFE